MKEATVFRKGSMLYMNNQGKLGEVAHNCPSRNKAKRLSRELQKKGEVVRVYQ